jgi:hypothetical protein
MSHGQLAASRGIAPVEGTYGVVIIKVNGKNIGVTIGSDAFPKLPLEVLNAQRSRLAQLFDVQIENVQIIKKSVSNWGK